MIPWCMNRPAPTGYWFLQPARHDRPKPVLRFRHHAMSVDCKAHDNPVAIVNGRPVTAPELAGWECRGCVWFAPLEIAP